MCVPIWRVLIALACMTDGVTPIGPVRSTPPVTKSEPDFSSVCIMCSSACGGSVSSASTKDRYSPVARLMP